LPVQSLTFCLARPNGGQAITVNCQRTSAKVASGGPRHSSAHKVKHGFVRNKNRPGEKVTIFCEKKAENPDGRKIWSVGPTYQE
jgi:hypothetical protein